MLDENVEVVRDHIEAFTHTRHAPSRFSIPSSWRI
jgi:hypothetical protein